MQKKFQELKLIIQQKIKRNKIKDDVSDDDDDFLLDKLGNHIYSTMERSIYSKMFGEKGS